MACESCQKKQRAIEKQQKVVIEQQIVKQTFENDITTLIERIKKSRNVKTPNKEGTDNA